MNKALVLFRVHSFNPDQGTEQVVVHSPFIRLAAFNVPFYGS